MVRNELGVALYKRAQQEDDGSPEQARFLKEAVTEFERTLELDAENLEAHYWLAQSYSLLGESAVFHPAAAGAAAASVRPGEDGYASVRRPGGPGSAPGGGG